MSLDRLLYEVTNHYRSRRFPPSALMHLRWTLLSNVNVKAGRFTLSTAYPGCYASIKGLLGQFQPAPPVDESGIRSATAVFGFAFGYRMEQWTEGTEPTDEAEVRRWRRPGRNNEELARRAIEIEASLGVPLLLQFEIADAVGNWGKVRCVSSRRDQGTRAVASELIGHASARGIDTKTAIIVAHQHHQERCRLALDELGVRGLPWSNPYDGYDPEEAQPRVMSCEEYIVNDFASMAGVLERK